MRCRVYCILQMPPEQPLPISCNHWRSMKNLRRMKKDPALRLTTLLRRSFDPNCEILRASGEIPRRRYASGGRMEVTSASEADPPLRTHHQYRALNKVNRSRHKPETPAVLLASDTAILMRLFGAES